MPKNFDLLAQQLAADHPCIHRAAYMRAEDRNLVTFFTGDDAARAIELLNTILVDRPFRPLGAGRTADGRTHVAVFSRMYQEATLVDALNLNSAVWRVWRMLKGIPVDRAPDEYEIANRGKWQSVQTVQNEWAKECGRARTASVAT